VPVRAAPSHKGLRNKKEDERRPHGHGPTFDGKTP